MEMPTRSDRPASSDPPVRHAAGPGRGGRVLLSLLALTLAVGPLGYVAARYWSGARAAASFAAAERGGIGSVRPVIALLAALVDAQDAQARGTAPDAAAVRSALDAVNRAVAGPDVPAQVRQSWSQVPEQVDAVLRANPTGQAAVTGYAAPVGLIQGLLHRMGDDSRIVRDPVLDTYHLMDTALFRVPDVIVNAGQLDALGHAASGRPHGLPDDTDARLAVARDRLASAGAAVSAGLRMGTGTASTDPGDLNLLRPLDEFVAAVDELTRAGTGTATDQAGAVDSAWKRVRQAALALDTAALDKLDALLRSRTDELAAQRRTALATGVLALLGTAALLFLLVLPGRRARATRTAQPAPDRLARYDPGLDGAGRDHAGRDGAGREGAGREGAGREGAGRDGGVRLPGQGPPGADARIPLAELAHSGRAAVPGLTRGNDAQR
jgi:hypothetical protein